MSNSLRGKVERDWAPPEGICYARVDEKTGNRISEDAPNSSIMPFLCGHEPERAAISGGPSMQDAISAGGI